MRILTLFIIFIISLSSVYAEDLNNYDSLELHVKVNGELQVVPESNSYTLDYISSELSFFPRTNDFQEKCLLGQPWRLAIKMIDEGGWILRNDIVWAKQAALYWDRIK